MVGSLGFTCVCTPPPFLKRFALLQECVSTCVRFAWMANFWVFQRNTFLELICSEDGEWGNFLLSMFVGGGNPFELSKSRDRCCSLFFFFGFLGGRQPLHSTHGHCRPEGFREKNSRLRRSTDLNMRLAASGLKDKLNGQNPRQAPVAKG